MTMRLFLLTCFCLGLIQSIQAQNVISGKVLDQKSGKSLQGAEITLKGSYRGTATDAKGKFRLKGLPGQSQTLVVNYLGYQKEQLKVNPAEKDTIRISLEPKAFLQDEVIVKGLRASRGTPTTFSNLEKEDIREENTGKNMPMILDEQPSVVSTSDDGLGIGYSGMRIRGTSQSRVNVTINGIPLNDAESQQVFWVDIPDIASSTDNIQIQRGVGTSTNGAGAFGATINLQTSNLKRKPYARLKNTFGSFNTIKNNLQFGTGMLNENWNFQGSFSRVQSDGYIDRASSELKSYYLSGGYYGENTIIKAIMFGGREKTYQAWLGVPESKMGDFPESQYFLGDLTRPIENLFGNNPSIQTGDRTFNPYTYENQVDHYSQDHYQLHISQKLNEGFHLSGALHYTYGRGYYEQYRDSANLALHQIKPVALGDTTINHSDLIRRRWLKNHFYGATFSAEYSRPENVRINIGGAWNLYDGAHFGRIKWTRFAGESEINHQFYDNDALKNDFNVYGKVNYNLSTSFSAFLDLQYRKVSYKTMGLDLGGVDISQSDRLNFFNPKAGLSYRINSTNKIYGFFGIANREPTRTDYINAPEGEKPSPERLNNLELGYERQGDKGKLKINGYLMEYQNQLVQTGELNDVGTPIRTNVDQSYRAGLELIGAYQFSPQWHWSGNLTLSRNRILNMDYKVSGQQVKTFEATPIAFSPPVIGSSEWQYSPFENFKIKLQTQYVGKQYLDNTGDPDKMISDYLINDLSLNYTLKNWAFFREMTARFNINNILNVHYASKGYTYDYFNKNQEIVTQTNYYPQAGRHYMGGLTLTF